MVTRGESRDYHTHTHTPQDLHCSTSKGPLLGDGTKEREGVLFVRAENPGLCSAYTHLSLVHHHNTALCNVRMQKGNDNEGMTTETFAKFAAKNKARR